MLNEHYQAHIKTAWFLYGLFIFLKSGTMGRKKT